MLNITPTYTNAPSRVLRVLQLHPRQLLLFREIVEAVTAEFDRTYADSTIYKALADLRRENYIGKLSPNSDLRVGMWSAL